MWTNSWKKWEGNGRWEGDFSGRKKGIKFGNLWVFFFRKRIRKNGGKHWKLILIDNFSKRVDNFFFKDFLFSKRGPIYFIITQKNKNVTRIGIKTEIFFKKLRKMFLFQFCNLLIFFWKKKDSKIVRKNYLQKWIFIFFENSSGFKKSENFRSDELTEEKKILKNFFDFFSTLFNSKKKGFMDIDY